MKVHNNPMHKKQHSLQPVGFRPNQTSLAMSQTPYGNKLAPEPGPVLDPSSGETGSAPRFSRLAKTGSAPHLPQEIQEIPSPQNIKCPPYDIQSE